MDNFRQTSRASPLVLVEGSIMIAENVASIVDPAVSVDIATSIVGNSGSSLVNIMAPAVRIAG